MTDKIPAVGSRILVWRNLAKHTSGGLKKKDLMRTKSGRIVSRKKHAQGLKSIKRLFALGYKPTKGTFKVMHKSMVDGRHKHGKHGKRHTRRRGGASMGSLSHDAMSHTTYGTGTKPVSTA